MSRLARAAATMVAALAALVAFAVPAAAEPQYFVWRWVECTPGALSVNAKVENLDASGYRYQVKSWFYNATGGTLRIDISQPWIGGHDSKTVSHPVVSTDVSVRTKVNRGHYEYPGGWQTWVNDQQLMDLTTAAC